MTNILNTPGEIGNKAFFHLAIEKGIAAEGRIGGALRGGRIYNGYFSSIGPVGTFHAQKVEDTSELKIHEKQCEAGNDR